MFKNIIQQLKQSALWYKISFSEPYVRWRSPKQFNAMVNELEFYKSVLGSNNRLIYDVGANLGYKSYIFSKISKKILLFEPFKSHLKILMARFGNNPKFVINDCALSSVQGEAEFFSVSENSAFNSLSTKHLNTVVENRGILSKSIVTSSSIQTNTLTNFIKKHGRPDYIKIDVEGHELEVIMGLKDLVPILSIEANLPEFLQETVKIINYLDSLANGKYFYNYSIENKLELADYTNARDFKKILLETDTRYCEVYCKLMEALTDEQSEDV